MNDNMDNINIKRDTYLMERSQESIKVISKLKQFFFFQYSKLLKLCLTPRYFLSEYSLGEIVYFSTLRLVKKIWRIKANIFLRDYRKRFSETGKALSSQKCVGKYLTLNFIFQKYQ